MRVRCESAAAEARHALRAERRERLAMVLALEGDDLERGGDVERGEQRLLQALVHRLLRVTKRERRARGEPLREGERVGGESLGGHDEVHQADAESLRRGD